MSLSSDRTIAVLHIASGDLWAGAEVQLYTLLSQLRSHDNIALHVALMNEGELANRLRARGIAVTVLDEDHLSAWQLLAALRRLMRELRPDIVHTHRIKENILGSLANLLATRAPGVRTVHGAPEHPPRGWRQTHKRLLAWLDTTTGRVLQDRIIAVSKGLEAPLGELFGPGKVVVIENGIDIDGVLAAVAPVEFRERESQVCHVGIVGRLSPVKRVDLFLALAALLLRTRADIDWRFHVIGDGPLLDILQQRAAGLGLDVHVTFHGHRGDSVACLAALDVLVMCSDHEGMPMTLLEAVTVGTAVLAHAVGGMVPVLENRRGGLLVHEHTAPAYAASLLELLAMPAESLRIAGQTHVRAHYAADVNAEKVSQLYRDII